MNYMKPEQIAETLQVNVKRVRKRIREMKSLIGTEYPWDAMLMDDGITRVDLSTYVEFCNRRNRDR